MGGLETKIHWTKIAITRTKFDLLLFFGLLPGSFQQIRNNSLHLTQRSNYRGYLPALRVSFDMELFSLWQKICLQVFVHYQTEKV